MIQLHLDKESAVPVYRQIINQVCQCVREGVLNPGERLFSTRQMAEYLNVHRNTVLKAYEELIASGILDSNPGSGTFVSTASELPLPASPPENNEVSGLNWDVMIRSECKDDFEKDFSALLTVDREENGINFHRYMPDPAFYPYETIRKIMSSVMRRGGSSLYKYGSVAGYGKLRDYLKRQAVGQGIDMSRNQVVVVNGSTQGLDLISRLVLNPGDVVAYAIPCYTGVVRLFTVHGVKFVTIPISKDGIDIEIFEQALKIHPIKLLYIIPNFHNPTGTTLSMQKRKRLMEAVQKHKVILLEDDFNFQLRFSGSPLPPVKALDSANQVVYSGTFSKILFSGFRIGWLIVPNEIYSNVLFVKKSLDITTSKLLQAVLYEFCSQGMLDKHLRKIRKVNRERFSIAIEALKRHFPQEVSWWEPEGGMMIWLNLPEFIDPLEIQKKAQEKGVYIAASPFFTPRGERTNGFRLSYAVESNENIVRGIEILGNILQAEISSKKLLINENRERESLTII